MRSVLGIVAAVVLVLGAGCDRWRAFVAGPPPVVAGPATLLTAPGSPDAPDLDLHHEWLAAEVRQRIDREHSDWPYRPFAEIVVMNGVAHRALLLLPSLAGGISRASFEVAVPPEADDELAMAVALFPRFAPESDGVDVAWAVGDATTDPTTVPLAFERFAGGAPADDWRDVRIDLAPWRGKTVWIVLATRAGESRKGDWVLFGDPRVRPKRRAGPVAVDLASPDALPRRPRAVPWRGAAVFKTYSIFAAEGPRYGKPEWLRASYPWLGSLRVLSALGANFGPTLAREDAARKAAGEPPASFEVGMSERYEFFRQGETPAADAFAWKDFDALNASAASAGAQTGPANRSGAATPSIRLPAFQSRCAGRPTHRSGRRSARSSRRSGRRPSGRCCRTRVPAAA